MDVRCGRCGTEYEFDDALISERGTTVKCTNCGHQFKIYPPQGGSEPERWVVRTTSGRELVYTSLRDLQRGIAKGQVGRDDLLSRGGLPPRPLSGIAELAPFFSARESSGMRQAPSAARPLPNSPAPRTLHGVAPPANLPPFLQTLRAGSSKAGSSNSEDAPAGPPRPSRAAEDSPGDEPPTPSRVEASTTEPAEPTAASSGNDPEAAPGPAHEEPATLPRRHEVEPGPCAMNDAPGPTPASALEEPVHAEQPLQPAPAVRRRLASYDDLTDPQFRFGGRSSTHTRWIVAVVLLGAIGLLAATVGRPYIARLFPSDAEQVAPRDARVHELLDAGQRLLDAGKLEEAKERLDKASVLAERDPEVRTSLARLGVIRADLSWLRLRLLAPEDEIIVQATHRELGERVERAQEAVERAFKLVPEEPAVVRARVDALRMMGQPGKARDWIGPIAKDGSQPENAYVLAMLDLAERSPELGSIVDRLSTAAAAERGLGRARAALIYVLVRAGDLARAQNELGKLQNLNQQHPLLPDLVSFVGRQEAADAGADGGMRARAERPAGGVGAVPAEDVGASGDFRARLMEAARASESGDGARAEQLYKSVLEDHPNNTEALAGLADVLRKRNDPRSAELYQRVLDANPSYLPALMARADQKWESGDRKGAVVLYRRVVEQAGDGTGYAQRARARIAEAESSAEATPERAPPRTAPAAPAKVEEREPPPETPHIDTTDLPEFNQ